MSLIKLADCFFILIWFVRTDQLWMPHHWLWARTISFSRNLLGSGCNWEGSRLWGQQNWSLETVSEIIFRDKPLQHTLKHPTARSSWSQPIYLLFNFKSCCFFFFTHFMLGDNSPRLFCVSACLILRYTDCFCSRLSFHEYLYSKYLWKMERVSSSEVDGIWLLSSE